MFVSLSNTNTKCTKRRNDTAPFHDKPESLNLNLLVVVLNAWWKFGNEETGSYIKLATGESGTSTKGFVHSGHAPHAHVQRILVVIFLFLTLNLNPKIN